MFLDQEYVTGYGMQIVSGYKQHDICEIAYKTLRTVESLNKVGNRIVDKTQQGISKSPDSLVTFKFSKQYFDL